MSNTVQTPSIETAAKIATPLIALVLALVVFPSVSRAQDPSRGKQLFEKRCTGCHSLDRNKEGPRLQGVYGRQIGTAPGFGYSAGMKAANFQWDEDHLNKWLTDTDSVVPDNKMDFHVAKADERADIISYLKSLSPASTAQSK